MRKYLLNSGIALTLALCSTYAVYADNVVYGVLPSWKGASTTSVDIDTITTDTVKLVTDKLFEEAAEVRCGVTAGTKYYAFGTTMDEGYNESYKLMSFNFTTGNLVSVAEYKYNQPGAQVSGMTYDKSADALYAIGTTISDEDDSYKTVIYKVNLATGELNEYKTLDGDYQSIVSDNNGGFYLQKNVTGAGWKTYANLYKVSADFDVTLAVENTTLATGYSYTNSMVASEDGNTVYLISGNTLFVFDVAGKTIAQKCVFTDNIVGASYGKSTEDGTAADQPEEPKAASKRFLTKVYTYDSEGELGAKPYSFAAYSSVPSIEDAYRKYSYYYNTDGKQVAMENTCRTKANDNDFSVVDVTKSVFDDKGYLTAKRIFQWGQYDLDEFCFKETANSETYTYNDNGQLIADSTSYKYNVYTYNEDGTLATKATYYRSTNQLSQSIAYSGYNEFGKPEQYVSDGAYDSFKYSGNIQYDEDGNKVEELQYTLVDDPMFPGEKMAKNIQYETWQYTDNILTEYNKSRFDADGNAVPDAKTTYMPVDGNWNDVMVYDSTCTNGKWYQEYPPMRQIYTDFTDMEEMTKVNVVAAKDESEINSVYLGISVPQLAWTKDCKFVIYRDCSPIDTVALFDIFDQDSELCIYRDKNVKNGTYDYFVQPIFSSGSEVGPLDEPGFDEPGFDDPGFGEDVTWEGYYVSNPVTVTFDTKLPAVEDLQFVGGEIKNAGTIFKPRNTYYADVKWTNPEDAEKYGFIRNSVYFVGAGVSELDIDDATADSAQVMLYDEDVKAYVMTRYQLGKAFSDTIDIKIKDIDAIVAGVDGVTVDGAVKATFAANVVTLSDNANVTVFSTNGQKVYEADNTVSVSLANLPKAVYVVVVEKNGKLNAYKYSVK